MIPSLFIWIPKTAGTSVWDACAASAINPLLADKRVPSNLPQDHDILCFSHRSVEGIVRRGLMPHDDVKRRFVFTFVRNPWSRLVSCYFYARTHPHMKRCLKKHRIRNFDKFVRHVTTKPIPPVGPYRYNGLSIVNPQTDWLRDINPDFIGRFERLGESWSELCDRLGIDAKLPHLKKTKHGKYRSYYSAHTRRLVRRFYMSDIERFGYTFQ